MLILPLDKTHAMCLLYWVRMYVAIQLQFATCAVPYFGYVKDLIAQFRHLDCCSTSQAVTYNSTLFLSLSLSPSSCKF